MKTSLIVGMGIGNLYAKVLTDLGHKIITVDSDPKKDADFTTIDSAIIANSSFDTAHICTPNFTHFELAAKAASVSKIVFIEKPGVADSFSWKKLVETFSQTRFMMIKNNMWRSNISDLKKLADKAKSVNIEWTRKNCIPNPGSWFTTKKLAYGGVSRDLMPHLLSLYIAMNPDWRRLPMSGHLKTQVWRLEDIKTTEYGTVNPNGIYDVDDVCNIFFHPKWKCISSWRSNLYEKSAIEFTMPDDTTEIFELGWCPEDAYKSMIQNAIDNVDNYEFWLDQFDKDMWIHEQIENL